MALVGFMGRLSCGLVGACATCARVDHSGDTRMPGAGKPTKSIRSKKTIGDVDQSNKSIGKPALIEKSDLTPQAARIAREEKLGKIGLDALLGQLSEPGGSFRAMAEWAGISTAQLWMWIKDDPARLKEYELAVEAKAHSYVDAAHELADSVVAGDVDPRRAEVKIKLSQWSAARTQAYQERKTVEHTVNHKLDLDDLKSRLSQLVDVAGQRAPTKVIEADYTIVTPIEADTQ